ncbi:MAG: exo-alpha-sialidase [Bryobacteraceae bacterium]|nr:exo-alpha-sialidase [Bryobacteraceae bacterium]
MEARITRRALLAAPAVLVLGAQATVRREAFLASPAKGVAVMAYAFYTRPTGVEMVSLEQRWTRSDTVDVAYVRRSRNNGRSWSAPVEMRTGERRPDGMWRLHPRGGFVDPASGLYIDFRTEGVLPSDDPLEGLRNWGVTYRISRDGGVTFSDPRPVTHAGAEFTPAHPPLVEARK